MLKTLITDQISFWEKCPALQLGVSALLGAFFYFKGVWILPLLWMVYQWALQRSWLPAAVMGLVVLTSAGLYESKPEPGFGQGVFSIDSVQPHVSPFHQAWLYKGRLKAFVSSQGEWMLSQPCTVMVRGPDRPKANCDYRLTGELRQRGCHDYSFRASQWEPIAYTFSLAELRCQAKERVRDLLHRRLHEPHVAAFHIALFTGEVEDRMLRYDFGRIGLQHILAISGFHFAILGAFVTFLLKLILPMRPRQWTLLAVVCLYFFFVGNAPAVLRSFLGALLYLLGQLLQKRTAGLNLLGACLLLEVFYDPLVVLHIGFQLSFLSCLGILLFYQAVLRKILPYFPRRRLSELIELPRIACLVYPCSYFLSRAFCLTAAVHLALGPLLLVHFHRFPYLSLLYNLFIPPLTAVCLFLLLISLLVHAVTPLLALPLFKITDLFSGQLLELISYPPAPLDYSLSLALPAWVMAPYLVLIFWFGIKWTERPLTFSKI